MKKRNMLMMLWALGLAGVVCLAGCLCRPKNAGCTKVLMIGNSFSICLMQHLPAVAADRGVELDLASLYIGGCSLKRHWENAERDGEKDYRPYAMWRNIKGQSEHAKMNICDALRMEDWDIVTIQQASHDSWKEKTYTPYGDNLVAKIRELAPNAKIYVQETWSYTPWDKRLERWGIDQNEMYDKLHSAYGAFAKKHDLEVIPFGTAVQEWRKRLPVKYTERSLGGDVVGGGRQAERDHFKCDNGKWVPNCDVFHLGRRGEYLQALVWARKLFDVELDGIDYCPSYVTEEEAKLMRNIAVEVNN